MRSYTGTREAINSTVVTVGGIYLATHSIIVTVAGTIASATHRLDSVADSSPALLKHQISRQGCGVTSSPPSRRAGLRHGACLPG